MPTFNTSTAIILEKVNIIILDFLLTFFKIFCVTNAYFSVLRYVDEHVYCLDQCFSKWSIRSSKC